MFRIHNVLASRELDELDRLLERGKFTDGRKSAGGAGQSIKNSLQLDQQDPNGPNANQLVKNALMNSDAFKSYAFPYKVSDITFSRYLTGMGYGEHTDNAINWDPRQVIRSDMSFTIFLSSPADYAGGELIIKILGDEKQVRFDRGDMAIYPSGLVHRVNTVTSGCRNVAIGWLQSLIPEQERREILHAVYQVRNQILVDAGRTEHFMHLDFAYSNLQRMWTQV